MFQGDTKDGTALANANALGRSIAYKELRDLTYEQIKETLEDDQDE